MKPLRVEAASLPRCARSLDVQMHWGWSEESGLLEEGGWGDASYQTTSGVQDNWNLALPLEGQDQGKGRRLHLAPCPLNQLLLARNPTCRASVTAVATV